MKKKHTERPGLSNDTQLLIKKSYATILRNAFKNDPLRRDVEPLIKFLDTCGFYKARCHSHHRYTCGAAQHQLEVLMLALDGKKPNDMAGHACCMTYATFTAIGDTVRTVQSPSI